MCRKLDDDLKEKRFLCFFHLHHGCKIIGFITIFLQAIPYFILYTETFRGKTPILGVFITLGIVYWTGVIVASVFMIKGVQSKNPGLFLPWLIVEPLSLCMMAFPLVQTCRKLIGAAEGTSLVIYMYVLSPALGILYVLQILFLAHCYCCVLIEHHYLKQIYSEESELDTISSFN